MNAGLIIKVDEHLFKLISPSQSSLCLAIIHIVLNKHMKRHGSVDMQYNAKSS